MSVVSHWPIQSHALIQTITGWLVALSRVRAPRREAGKISYGNNNNNNDNDNHNNNNDNNNTNSSTTTTTTNNNNNDNDNNTNNSTNDNSCKY